VATDACRLDAAVNPAVSLAFRVTGRLGNHRCMWYIAAQFAGGIVGAFFLKLALPPALLATPFTTSGSLTAAHPVQVRHDIKLRASLGFRV
jgi:glycerol uptake facilitator-like aquaporin